MKKSLLFIFLLGSLGSVFGQVVYSQDFENGTADMIFLDIDKKTPNTNVSTYTASWKVRAISGNNWATSNSYFTSPANADDWMITPIISGITETTFVTWDAFSTDGSYRDNYEVRVSLGGTTPADFTKVIFSIDEEDSDVIAERGASLKDFVGKDIRIAFRNISFDKFLINIDNIKVFETKARDVSLLGTGARKYVLKGESEPITYSIKNFGNQTITSMDIEWTDGIDVYTDNLTGLAIEPFATYNGEFNSKAIIDDATIKNIKSRIVSINGGVNENANIESDLIIHGALEKIQRKMVVEEATGTWCGWCPRGAVNMAKMKDLYHDEFIGIAVHNSTTDPMLVAAYDKGITSLPGFGGFPSVIINREKIEDPGNLEDILISQLRNEVAPADIKLSTTLSNRKVTADLTVKFNTEFTGEDLKLIGVLVEDGVKGTASGYNQANYYANNAQGVMGGYEKLANPVPAAKMVYNEVGRKLIYDFAGKSINKSAVKAGDEVDFLFDVDVDAKFKLENVSLVVMVADGSGVIIGGAQSFVTPTGVNDIAEVANKVSLSPNPASDVSYINLDIIQSNDVEVTIFNQIGQSVAKKAYGKLAGKQMLPINVDQFNKGMYFVKINVGNKTTTQKLIVE